jgi:hypothetical protein
MMFGLSCATHMRALLRLSLHVEILITGSTNFFSQKPGESLDDCFARFESIVSSLCSCDPLAYSDNERAKQLLYALDGSVWGMKITALEEFADFATLDIEKLFSKLKSHELSRKGHLNHDASLTSKTFVTRNRVGGHVANPTNTTDSSALEFALSSMCAASDNCKMSMVNYADLWLVYSSVASLLDGARVELRELKARSTLLGACIACPMLRVRLRRVQPSPHTDWVLGLRGVRIRVRRVLPSLFLAPPTTKRKQQSNPSKLTTHPTQSHPSIQREKQGKKPQA